MPVLLVASLTVVGCLSRADLVPAMMSTTGTEADTQDESESSEPEPDLPPAYEPCECAPDELCVADCDVGVYLENFRCLGPPECNGDVDDPMCLIEACEYSFATLEDCDGETFGADIVCFLDYELYGLCRSLDQDCPEDEKCVLQVIGWEQLYTGQCVPHDEPGAAVGEACSSEGIVTGLDDCGADSMCWTGEVSSEPFVGTYHAFCTLENGEPTCPEGSACEMIGPDDFYLCVPN